MAKNFALFPGQGSQSVGMTRELLEDFPKVAEIFEEAEDATKLAIRKLCAEGPAELLMQTEHLQPCILAVSIAKWQVLREEAGFCPEGYAGHSLGEYSALVAAGKLSLFEAAKLVQRRGRFMQQAVSLGEGAMAAVISADSTELQLLCIETSKDSGSTVQIANDNSPAQKIVAGTAKAVVLLRKRLLEKGLRSIALPVSAPFHSVLMKPARDAMEPLLAETRLVDNEARVMANVVGDFVNPYTSKYLLEQIDQPVLWTQSMKKALAEDFSRFVEIGPGNVLVGIAKRWFPKNTVTLLTTNPLADAIASIAAASQ